MPSLVIWSMTVGQKQNRGSYAKINSSRSRRARPQEISVCVVFFSEEYNRLQNEFTKKIAASRFFLTTETIKLRENDEKGNENN